MAYFSNGSEGALLDAECADCALGQEPCPIASVQVGYNYQACNNKVATKILDALIKQEKGRYLGCQMKPFIDELANNRDVEGQMKLFGVKEKP